MTSEASPKVPVGSTFQEEVKAVANPYLNYDPHVASTINSLSLDEDTSNRMIKLTSKDNVIFQTTLKNAILSNLVKTTLESDKEATEIPLPGVKSRELKQIVDYMNHHNGVVQPIIPCPLKSKKLEECVFDKWDADFIKTVADQATMYELILAANYMDMKCLLHLACAGVASLIKGESLDNTRAILENQGKNSVRRTPLESKETETKEKEVKTQ